MENSVVNKKEIIIKCSLGEMIKAFFKDYVIVWHDPNVNSLENKGYITQLTKFCDVFPFTNWERAKDYIHQAKLSCHVITSGKNGELLVKEIYLNENVENIYVFCGDKEQHTNWDQRYNKVSCVENQIEKILSHIHKNLIKWSQKWSSLKSDLPAIAPLFNNRDKSEMYHRHLRLKTIPKFKNRQQAKDDFLALSEGIYTHQSERKYKDDFEKNYNKYDKEQILRWYTTESFLHKVTNNCLRISTSDSIQYSRLLICDLENAIKEQYQTKTKNFCGLLYRAAPMSNKEWSSLKENLGKEIEMSDDFHYNYCAKGPNEEEQGFAEIEEYSQFAHEKEILFNVRSRFTILEAEDEYSENLPCRHLVLLYGAQGFRKFIAERNPVQEVLIPSVEDFSCAHCKVQAHEMPGKVTFLSLRDHQEQCYCQKCSGEKSFQDSGPFLCVSILNPTEKFETKKIQGCLLMNSSEREIPFYGYKCGKCQKQKQKQYFTCADCDEREKRWCQNCFELKLNCIQAGHNVILETNPFSFLYRKMSKNELNYLKFHNDFFQKDENIFQQAEMFVKNHEYTKAIDYYHFYIQENETKGEDADLATAYNNLGRVFLQRRENTTAFRFLLKSLNIRKSIYGDNHPNVADSYHNIGVVYYSHGEYDKALEYHLKSMNIQKSAYGDIHLNVAVSYNAIGSVYHRREEYIEALRYHLKSLDIRKQVYGDIHPDIAVSYNSIGVVYHCQGEYKKALKYHSKSLHIRRLVYGDNHPDIAGSYANIGSVHSCQKEDKKALEYYLKSLDIQKLVYGDNHLHVAVSYNNLATVCLKQKEYNKSLEYPLKSHEVYKIIYGENHPKTIEASKKIKSIIKKKSKRWYLFWKKET